MKLKLIGAAFALAFSGYASASAIITDGNVSLGVDNLGQLNVDGGVSDVTGFNGVGMRYIDDNGVQYESTAHGCACEGWGVGIGATGETGFANNSRGISGLSLVDFTSTATEATSIVETTNLQVTHQFALADETDNLFRVVVEIANIGTETASDVRYRRTFDWDTSPTPFFEYVTIDGTAESTATLGATNNGFCSSNVFASCNEQLAGGTGDFNSLGPSDHGANFDFGFGDIAVGEAFTFEIFYGGAIGEAAALASLGEVGAEVYSFGWSGNDIDQDGFDDSSGELTPTFIFGFAGVGGEVIIDPTPDPVSEPALLGLFGLVGLIAFRSRRKSA